MKVSLKSMMTLLSLWLSLPATAGVDKTEIDFSSSAVHFEKVGRGVAEIKNGVFLTKDSYGLFGDPDLSDYEYSFRARSGDADEPVQIWSGFRGANHHDRYMIGVRGGLQDDIILMRLGYLGTEEFLGQRPLRFHPEPGEWYEIKVQVCGPRIRVFVGENDTPYLDMEDKNAGLIKSGGVILGGGWVETEFDDLRITPIPADALTGVKKSEFRRIVTDEMRNRKRMARREAYRPVTVAPLTEGRTRISLVQRSVGKRLF